MSCVTCVVRAWAVEVLDFAVFDRVVDLVDFLAGMVIMRVKVTPDLVFDRVRVDAWGRSLFGER